MRDLDFIGSDCPEHEHIFGVGKTTTARYKFQQTQSVKESICGAGDETTYENDLSQLGIATNGH